MAIAGIQSPQYTAPPFPFHRYDKYIWPGGDTYEGEFTDGQMNGYGRIRYTEGIVYEGSVKNGIPHGKGQFTFPNGDRYEGDCANGQMHGQGRLTFANGNVYIGKLEKGNPHGSGKMTFPNGDFFDGIFQNGQLLTGRGRLTLKDGLIYIGDISNRQITGWGRLHSFPHFIDAGFFVNGKLASGFTRTYDDKFFEFEAPNEKGTRFFVCTLKNGMKLHGNFANGFLNYDISNLGEPCFISLVTGTFNYLCPAAYTLGIMSDYLLKNNYCDLGEKLKSANEIFQGNLDLESNRVFNALKDNKPQLLCYGFNRHYMGLNILPHHSYDSVVFEIFNSDPGLETHPRHPTNPPLYWTKK